jgi:serine protease Do
MRYADNDDVRANIARGAVVASVTPSSPAEKAGLQPTDVILKAGSRAIRSAYDWEAVLLDLRVGETVALKVRRGTREFDTSVTVQDLPEVTAPKVQVLQEMELVTLTSVIRVERGIRSEAGALVVRVGQRTASEIGIQAGDVIYGINQRPVKSAEDVKRAIDQSGGYVRMHVERGGAAFVTDFRISR